MKRITKAALGGLAGCALAIGGTQVASGALSGTYKFTEGLADLLTDDWSGERPFDSTRAKTTIVKTSDGRTTFTLRVTGIDPSSVPEGGYGAHLHVGPCSDSGPHYQHVFGGAVSPENEVWFALVPDEDGMALSETTVDFVPDDMKSDYDVRYIHGEMSIVIHVLSSGGTKQACFPLSVSGIFTPTSE